MRQDFTKEVHVAAPPAEVWSALLDFRRVASWLPIVRDVREVETGRRYGAMLEDRMGPFALRADLEVTVDANVPEKRMHVAAAGEDRQVASRISATLDLTANEEAGGTVLTVEGSYEITGRIATLGAGAIRKKGERVLEDFFRNAARGLASG